MVEVAANGCLDPETMANMSIASVKCPSIGKNAIMRWMKANVTIQSTGLGSNTVWKCWLFALIACSLLFVISPRVDLTLSNVFYNNGFFVSQWSSAEICRQSLLGVAILPCVLALTAIGASFVRSRPFGFSPVQYKFVILLYILGPGILVNGFLKRFWGRARPEAIAEFGGSAEFTPALRITDQCISNCSFVSAETSAVTASTISVFVLTVGFTDFRWRFALRSLSMLILLAIAVLRVMVGKHFVSDVVFAVLLTFGCALFLTFILSLAEPADNQ